MCRPPGTSTRGQPPERIEVSKDRKRKQLPHQLRKLIYERDNKTCQLCGRVTIFGGLYDHPFTDDICGSVDHIIPHSLGGEDNPENLRWACRSCNCSRRAKYDVPRK